MSKYSRDYVHANDLSPSCVCVKFGTVSDKGLALISDFPPPVVLWRCSSTVRPLDGIDLLVQVYCTDVHRQ